MTLRKYILFVFAILTSLIGISQIEVRAVMDSSVLRIGAQTKLDIYLNYDASTHKKIDITWPIIEDTLKKGVEVVSIGKIDTIVPDKNKPNLICHHLKLMITSFDSGSYMIPPFKFLLNHDTVNPFFTEPLYLLVNTIATDTALVKIKDIKPIYDEPFDWKWYLPYFYILLAILLAIITGIILFKKLRKKKEQEVVVELPKVPSHILALESLEKIKNEAIWKDNKIKEYYTSITDTIRLYIEGRFNINALELTSDEIMTIFKSQVVDAESKSKLNQILTLSDFVKFAKQIPIEAEHTLTLSNAFDFVKGTMREEYSSPKSNEGEGKTSPKHS